MEKSKIAKLLFTLLEEVMQRQILNSELKLPLDFAINFTLFQFFILNITKIWLFSFTVDASQRDQEIKSDYRQIDEYEKNLQRFP